MSTAVRFLVRRVRTHRELSEALKLRHEVFCVEQGVPEREELDGRDHEGIHLIAVTAGGEAQMPAPADKAAQRGGEAPQRAGETSPHAGVTSERAGEPRRRAAERHEGAAELLGTCRLVLVGRTAQFSRLAVRASVRRQGIATALLEAADAESRAAGARRVVLHAQTYARPLYEQAGYVTRGSAFREAGIEHIAMEKELS